MARIASKLSRGSPTSIRPAPPLPRAGPQAPRPARRRPPRLRHSRVAPRGPGSSRSARARGSPAASWRLSTPTISPARPRRRADDPDAGVAEQRPDLRFQLRPRRAACRRARPAAPRPPPPPRGVGAVAGRTVQPTAVARPGRVAAPRLADVGSLTRVPMALAPGSSSTLQASGVVAAGDGRGRSPPSAPAPSAGSRRTRRPGRTA